MIRTVPQNRVTELLVMVSRGGPFAEAIFMAFNTAARGGFRDTEEKVEEAVKDEQKGEREGDGEGGKGAGGEKDTEEDKGNGGEGEGEIDGAESDKGVADVGGAAEAQPATEGASIFGGGSTTN